MPENTGWKGKAHTSLRPLTEKHKICYQISLKVTEATWDSVRGMGGRHRSERPAQKWKENEKKEPQ